MYPMGQMGYPGAFGAPSMNPSPFQYPAPSSLGQGMMQNQPAQQAQQTGPDWIRVATAQQVEQVSVQPGGKAWVMVENMPLFALRVADNMGLVTTDFYRFEKIDAGAATGAQSGAVSGNGMTREEVDALISERLSAFADTFKPNVANKNRKGDAVNE